MTLSDVRFEEQLVTGTTKRGRRLTLRCEDVVQQVLLGRSSAEVEGMSAVVALRRKPCGCITTVFTNERLARQVKDALPGEYRLQRLPPAKAWVQRCRHNCEYNKGEQHP